MVFQVGQAANPGGKHKEKLWRAALDRAFKRRDADGKDGDPKALEKLADKVIDLAMMGDMSAVKEIAERLDGKVPQVQVLNGDEDGGPIRREAGLTIIYGGNHILPGGAGNESVLIEQQSQTDADRPIRIG